MRQALKLHPDSRCDAATHIAVTIARPRPHVLTLHYVVTGRMGDLRLPPATDPTRADGLWRRTCFEAFVRVAHSATYYEFNFAPSTQWAAYRFSGYREGMRALDEIGAPRIETQSSPASLELQIALELSRLQGLPGDSVWRLGVSAVIEETNGRKSYWALAHPPGKPDFHHAHGFVHELAVAERS